MILKTCTLENLIALLLVPRKQFINNHLTAFLSHFSAFMEASAAGIFLDKQQIKAQVCSAALNVFPLGVLKHKKFFYCINHIEDNAICNPQCQR